MFLDILMPTITQSKFNSKTPSILGPLVLKVDNAIL